MLATVTEACREYARNAGMDDPDRAWILTPWDSWERNPFYRGPAVRHPEDYDDPEEIERWLDDIEINGPTFWTSNSEIPF